MRTIPRQLARFREIVSEHGRRLRKLSYEELYNYGNRPAEVVEVNGRAGSIGVIVLRTSKDMLQIVIKGFLTHRFFPGKSVALDGFYKYRDGTIAPMHDFYGFE